MKPIKKKKMSKEKEEALIRLRTKAGNIFLVIGVTNLIYCLIAIILVSIILLGAVTLYQGSNMPFAGMMAQFFFCFLSSFVIVFIILCAFFIRMIFISKKVINGIQYKRTLKSARNGVLVITLMLMVLLIMSFISIILHTDSHEGFQEEWINSVVQFTCFPTPVILVVEIVAITFYLIGIRLLKKSKKTFTSSSDLDNDK